jgi:mono/diheme cytochrome c family protein
VGQIWRWMLLAWLLAVPGLARTDEVAVARGRYLATAGDCEICHTSSGGGAKPYAGGYALHAIFGTVYSTNLTPDKDTGIGNWTPAQFHRALHSGIGGDGEHLYPAFPYIYFARVNRADSDAIFAYLRTVKPVTYRPPPNRLIFPTNIRMGMAVWDALFLDHTRHPPDPAKSGQWNRGADLVNGLGHCGGCHTPKNILFDDKKDELFRGETIDGWYAPNLTGTMRDGLGKWSAADIATYLKTGGNRFGRVTGAMADVVRVSTSHLTDGDLAAIAVYLKSLPAAPEPSPPAPNADAMAAGQAVFVERCAICHQAPGYPPLAGNGLVQSRDPTTVVRVILQGSQSYAMPRGRIGFSMPAFPVLSNAELADVATYIRNAWGNRASPVSKTQAKRLRHMLDEPS